MNHNQPHEPETKSFNKARGFQNAVLRLKKMGRVNDDGSAEELKEWCLNEASSQEQSEFFRWAMNYWWDKAEDKIERREGSSPAPRRPARPLVSPERRAEIEAQAEKKAKEIWVGLVRSMTGAQVRAAKSLPDEMAAQVADDQKVGEVFTDEQLRTATQKE